MTDPDWRHMRAGARVRVALWLQAEVGEGGVFTKAQLRSAFPSIEQIDRRMRDLRAEGWVIATYREDRSLAVDELRLKTIGGRVWERGYKSRTDGAISDTERRKTLAADRTRDCRICGAAAGEAYPDDPSRSARLTVQRTTGPSGSEMRTRTVCDRCRAGESAGLEPEQEDALIAQIASLPEDAGVRLRSWMTVGRREVSQEQRIWARYWTLPAVTREQIAKKLGAVSSMIRETEID